MNKILLLIILLSISLTAGTQSTTVVAAQTTPNSVVKVFSAISVPNYAYPWQTSRISKFTGSGAVIKDNQILTSAHVVSSAKFIEVKKENDPNKYIANIKFISHQADLAILEVKDKSFFKDIQPLKLSENIKVRDAVTVLGYPIGGNTISTTSGIVSRIEYRRYVWSQFSLLAIQIDAAINSGNSGGPVINKDNELVGIAMMKINKSSNIGYIVPSLVVNTFLEDIKDGVVNGFHSDSITTQKINNDTLKKFYNLKNGNGILVTHVGIDENLLKVNDVILSVEGKKIANNNTIKTKYGRVNSDLGFHMKQIGKTIDLKILRNKKELTVKYKLKKVKPLIVHEFGKEPRYIIYGGFTFAPLTKNYLRKIYNSSNGLNMLFYGKDKTKDYSEPVVSLHTIFPNKTNRGYKEGSNVLIKVNNIKLKNFKHLINILDNIKEEYSVFEFLEKRKIVLSTKQAKESIVDIKTIYNIKNDRRID